MPNANDHPSSRREFLGSVTAATLLVTGGQSLAAQPSPAATPVLRHGEDKWDHSWLERLTGKHKQVFDIEQIDPRALLVVRNYLNAFRDVYGLQHPDINVVMGIAGAAYIMDFQDAIWEKFEFGKTHEVKDPRTGQHATRNIFRAASAGEPDHDATIEALQARGATVLMCNNRLKSVTARLAARTKTPPDELRAELIAGLLPGVVLVPAHTMALGLAQERGCSYEKL